ncbi:uncharacterized protein C6orf132 homolog [Spea bombifrons]|uniref:uncharacterized protein C6orf132 homolog n=1 Tax=Spea bombifrons TaxID=233779 RepID=UPI00234A5073|nr:uncharacterized protein C6orf132 homolog [Spea bombifrons]
MKKSNTMQGTLSKLFGKKNTNNNSLFADNPPWILPQGAKKGSDSYKDGTMPSFSFLDESGTATLKARPGPRARPMLNFSTSNTETQALAVPTPSVPPGFSDNLMGNGAKLNGNYRMYSSVGDLRGSHYYEDNFDEDIPAPPNMPPPPPPTMPPPPPPQESPPSSTISSPASPSPPDFIPPTPNTSVPTAPNFNVAPVPPTIMSHGDQQPNVSKWKSETILNTLPTDEPVGLPNRFSLTPTLLHKHEQPNYDIEPRSTLPRSFKNPPPAPARTSSIQQQEQMIHQRDIMSNHYAKEPPLSPLASSFNPNVQAKLFATTGQGQTPINDTLNKRKSMIIMEGPQTVIHSIDQNVERTFGTERENVDFGPSNVQTSLSLPVTPVIGRFKSGNETLSLGNVNEMPAFDGSDHKQPNKITQNKTEIASVVSVNDQSKGATRRPQSSIEFNKIKFNKEAYSTDNSKPTIKVISLKPILDNFSIANTNVSGKKDSLTKKDINAFNKDLESVECDMKSEAITPPPVTSPPPPPSTAPPNPPSMPPPPPPTAPPPLPPMIPLAVPPKTPPAPPPAPPLPTTSHVSPVVDKNNDSPTFPPAPPLMVPPPPPPKVPPAPPLLLPASQTLTSGQTSQLPLHKALQAKEESLKHLAKKANTIEIRPAQLSVNANIDDDQKNRVGKIKEELEAFLSSPKKDDQKIGGLKNVRQGLEIKNKNANINVLSKGGDTNLVNSLMLKVPLLPAKPDKEDPDADNSEWLPKSSKVDIKIPEPDYLPTKHTPEATHKKHLVQDTKPSLLEHVPPSPPKATDISNRMNPIPSYKSHHERKASAGSWNFDLQSSKPDTLPSLEKESISKSEKILLSKDEPPVEQPTSVLEPSVTEDKIEPGSPMALLLAAKRRAQKGPRSRSVDRSILPKVLVTSPTNTFAVVPKQENKGHISQEGGLGALNDTNIASTYSGSLLNKSSWRDEGFQVTNLDRPEKHSLLSSDYNSLDNDGAQYPRSKTAPKTDSSDNNWKAKSAYLQEEQFTNESSISTNKSHDSGILNFNISSFPSPTPPLKTNEDIEFEIIPPPAEFMNSPGPKENEPQKQDMTFSYNNNNTRDKVDFGIQSNEYNYTTNQTTVSQTTSGTRDYNRYANDNYSTGTTRDSRRSSLIKQRLYMPEPEAPRNYGKNPSSLRSAPLPLSYSQMHSHSNSAMAVDPRRPLAATSRYLPQGRRVSSENLNRMGMMNDMKYKLQNQDYSAIKTTVRPQSNSQGMTFTVRPGTRQPISNTYQGGYM